ncbi:MAG TPA: RelA/SpoT domain-containing protein [Solirubrobacteraceae bacterium]|jgi:putative GTP pyrophosphokinase|nr:RelA/SpoT domain-containing protein [Solirubrobacteraceae bacterium]
MALDREEASREYDTRARRYERANQQITAILNALLDDLSARYRVREGLYVTGKPKCFSSFYRKATDKYACESLDEAFERVRDLARVRVVCPTLDDCYSLLEMLLKQQAVFVDERTIEDYIADPSPTGYRAIHLEAAVEVTVSEDKVSVPVEVQIRSTLQEAWGHYTHSDFYHAEAAPEHIALLMKALSDLLHWSDRHASILVKEVARQRDEQERSGQQGGVAADKGQHGE